MVESIVFGRLAEAVQKPKVLEDVVKKINQDRTKNVVPLRKELGAIDRELTSIETQRKRFFKPFETSGVDDDLFVERLSELKIQHEQFARRKAEAERQLADSISDPVPLQQVHMKDRRKVAGIELEFDPTVQKHFFDLHTS